MPTFSTRSSYAYPLLLACIYCAGLPPAEQPPLGWRGFDGIWVRTIKPYVDEKFMLWQPTLHSCSM